jgi:hypothetical protein
MLSDHCLYASVSAAHDVVFLRCFFPARIAAAALYAMTPPRGAASASSNAPSSATGPTAEVELQSPRMLSYRGLKLLVSLFTYVFSLITTLQLSAPFVLGGAPPSAADERTLPTNVAWRMPGSQFSTSFLLTCVTPDTRAEFDTFWEGAKGDFGMVTYSTWQQYARTHLVEDAMRAQFASKDGRQRGVQPQWTGKLAVFFFNPLPNMQPFWQDYYRW